jgi:hypothetical protein
MSLFPLARIQNNQAYKGSLLSMSKIDAAVNLSDCILAVLAENFAHMKQKE